MLGQNGQYSFTKSTPSTPEGTQAIDVPSGLTLDIYSLSDLSTNAKLKQTLFPADRKHLERRGTESAWKKMQESDVAKKNILNFLISEKLVQASVLLLRREQGENH